MMPLKYALGEIYGIKCIYLERREAEKSIISIHLFKVQFILISKKNSKLNQNT